MALNFPSGQPDGTVWTDPNGEQWVYNAAENSWTSKGLVNDTGGLKYKGSLDITAAPPTAEAGEFWSVETGGTAHAGFGPGVTGNVDAGSLILYDGTEWDLLNTSPYWTRTNGAITPVNATDVIHGESGVTVGPNDEIDLNANGNVTGKVILTQHSRLTSSTAEAPIFNRPAGEAVIYGTSDFFLTTNTDNDTLRLGGGPSVYAEYKKTGTSWYGDKIKLNASDGSATFVGDIEISSTGDENERVLLRSAGGVVAYRKSVDVWTSLSLAPKEVPTTGYQILAGGTFNADDKVPNCWINAAGDAYFQDRIRIGGTLPSSPNISLNSDGSGNYAGTITTQGGAGGPYVTIGQTIGFNLEADNPDHYTTTTEEYEDTITGPGGKIEKTVAKTRDIRTYTGPVLDVKAELQALRERATQQDAVIAEMRAQMELLKASTGTQEA